ncbi:MAG TPA: MoaD/ThiS family protein [Pseudonocardia sp.]|nr:MoaD/ThiS family protein [Pseudonocardia sp.]
MSVVTVRYFAGARAAAGVTDERVPVPAGGTVNDVLKLVTARHGAALARVLDASSLLLDEVAVRDRSRPLTAGATLDVLPPFAGG